MPTEDHLATGGKSATSRADDLYREVRIENTLQDGQDASIPEMGSETVLHIRSSNHELCQ
jgi:hypothetical protein